MLINVSVDGTGVPFRACPCLTPGISRIASGLARINNNKWLKKNDWLPVLPSWYMCHSTVHVMKKAMILQVQQTNRAESEQTSVLYKVTLIIHRHKNIQKSSRGKSLLLLLLYVGTSLWADHKDGAIVRIIWTSSVCKITAQSAEISLLKNINRRQSLDLREALGSLQYI